MSSSTSILILASGNSSRLGLPKQLLQHKGRSLLRHAAEIALAAHPAEVVCVLGFESDRMKHELDDLAVRCVLNAGWHEGVASSLREGISSLPVSVDSALITLCDQPFVTSSHLANLMSASGVGHSISATSYENAIGVPACFARSVFPELLDLHGDAGAKKVINRDLSRVTTIFFPEAGIDIDTLRDYQSHINSTH
jgi:molybdenum cofactor cytidylyltransferase